MGIDSMMKSSKDLWLVFLLVNISLLVSCKDNNLSLKERIWVEENLDNGIEILSDDKYYFSDIKSEINTPLLKDMRDAYHAFTILNSVRNDMELFFRFNMEEAVLPLEHLKVSNVSDETIRNSANKYISNTFMSRNDTTGIVTDEYNHFKSILIDRYQVDKYGAMSEEIYWNEYDENKRVANFDSILTLRIEDENKARDFLETHIITEKDFDKQCIYLKEYAKTFYNGKARDERFDKLFLKLENQMNQEKYSIYLMEIWRLWRVFFQEGHSKDSPIYNKIYNEMRLVCCRTILNHIIEYPMDIMAINQFLVMASLDNINRYGEYPYGNQVVMEEINLFPEYYYEEDENN